MHEENKTKGRVAIALFLCFCVMALTSFLAVKSSLNKITGNETAAADNKTAVSEPQEAASETPVVDSRDGTVSGEQQEGSESENCAPAPKYIMPVNGNILLKYAMDSLVYSKTLDQYMTHPGTDISAPLSSEVTAIADGTISKVYNDDRYGITVQIAHEDGITSRYSNLSEHGLAETGDQVTQGQVIGSVGDSALFESLDEPHLHFEILKDSNCENPGDYIEALNQ